MNLITVVNTTNTNILINLTFTNVIPSFINVDKTFSTVQQAP